jgi:hypothetical protein
MGYTPPGEPLRFLHENVLTYKGEDCLWWPYGRSSTGYGEVIINRVQRNVHVVVCEITNGPKPSQNHVASHICGKGRLACVNPNHLRWQTRAEDCADKVIHGTTNRGSRNGKSILTKESVLEIRSLEGKFSRKEIAKQFGVHKNTINDIMHRRRWGWL